MKMKTRDLAMVMENEALKKLAYKQFTTINKKAYPIMQHKADSVLDAAHEFVNTSLFRLMCCSSTCPEP